MEIFTKGKRMQKDGWWWRSKSKRSIAEPPACPSSVKPTPSPGDIYVHFYGDNVVGRQVWLRSGKHTWQFVPEDFGNAQVSWPQNPRPFAAPLFLKYPMTEDVEAAAPNWVTWPTIQKTLLPVSGWDESGAPAKVKRGKKKERKESGST